MLNNLMTSQNHTQTIPAWRKPLPCWGLLFALSLSTLSTAPNVLAQNSNDRGPAVPARLGLKPGGLIPQEGGNAYQANPFAEAAGEEAGGLRGVAGTRSTSGVSDMVGTLSVQNFQGTQTALSNTHASADGFRNYFNTWYTPNFARRDSAVSVWLYHDVSGGDNYDLWNSGGTDYGIDAVRVAWHSGHGGMWSTNVFFAPMGANWASRGWNAFSNQMILGGNNYGYGDERLRYLFWDTCNSVMVSGGHDPYSTWGTRSRGIRMVFGYETVSIDSDKYGKYFWEEWNKGKTLAQAFLDASWRINTNQSPAVVAFGSNSTDATNRLNTERYLYAGSVGNNWGQWRWYIARSAAGTRQTDLSQETQAFGQTQPRIHRAAVKNNSPAEIAEIARVFGIEMRGAQVIQNRPHGLRVVETQSATLVMEANGNFELDLRAAELPSKTKQGELADEVLIKQAHALAAQLSLLQGQEVTVGLIRDLNESGGGPGTTQATRVVEKTVVFNQMIDGLPFIDPEAGHLEITFDARTGQARRVRSSLQRIEAAQQGEAQITKSISVQEARFEALAKAKEQAQVEHLEIVPGSEALGWQLLDGQIVPVFRAEIKDPQNQFGRPQLAIVPLVKTN